MIEFMNVGFFQIQNQHKFNNWDNDFMDYHRESMMNHQMCHSGCGPEKGGGVCFRSGPESRDGAVGVNLKVREWRQVLD